MRSDIYKKLFRAKEFIDDSFSEPVRLNDIAKQACLSEYHFLRLFSKVYNITPHRYLVEKRIESAKELLKRDSLSITDVCFEAGFESPSAFCSVFNKFTGMAPGEFRAENMRRVLMVVNFPEKLIPACFLHFR